MWSLAHLQTPVGQVTYTILIFKSRGLKIGHLNVRIACMLKKIEEVRILVQKNPFGIFSLMLSQF